jgi:drug/metabolite transporter (DMT)-like permease
MSDQPYGPGQWFWMMMIVLAGIGFGLAPYFVRTLLDANTDPSVIAFARFALTAVIMLPFLSFGGRKGSASFMGMVAGILMGFGWVGFIMALKYTTVVTAGVSYMAYPMFTMLFAWALLGSPPGPRGFLAGFMALTAVYISLTPNVFGDMQIAGISYLLMAPLSFGFAVAVMSGWLGRLNPLERLACVPLGACIGLAPAMWITTGGQVLPAEVDWMALIGLAVLTLLLPGVLYAIAAPRIGLVRTAICGSVELPVMVLSGLWLLGDGLRERDLAAVVLVIVAILVVSVSGQPKGRPPAA